MISITGRNSLSFLLGRGCITNRGANFMTLKTRTNNAARSLHQKRHHQYTGEAQGKSVGQLARHNYVITCRGVVERRQLTYLARPFSEFTKSPYIHPLSQIILEHLQSYHSDWVERMGLETGLRINEDGTFVLRFPISGDAAVTSSGDQAVENGDGEDGTTVKDGSIWTMYEPEERKHYLCVSKGGLVGRYMLQDNKKPAWHSDKRSTPERVQDAVDEMIKKIEGGV